MLRIMCTFLLFCAVLHDVASGCDVLTETHHGCKIENSQCICGFGCKAEFRYSTKKECSDTLKGRSSDVCTRLPCLNGGTCIQISLNPGYKCGCEGTKHYGNRCQRPCPKEYSATRPVPHECVEI